MRSILIHGAGQPSMNFLLETGLSLARAHDGHVTVLIDTPIRHYVALDSMGSTYVASDALRQALARDDATAAAYEALLAGQDVPFDVQRSEAELVEALAAAARLADLVIVARSSGIAGELALTARAPVLLVPDGQRLGWPLTCACIGWDGGDEAAVALRSALPLLRDCADVHVLAVKEKSGGFPPTDALRYLSRHGIKAELSELARHGSIQETLARGVRDRGADLLVMGAYGKSRMREFLFGGVTEHFLTDAAGPALLLAH